MRIERLRVHEWEGRVNEALDLIRQYGGSAEAHHQQWVLDQVVRALTDDRYEEWRALLRSEYDGEVEDYWSEGIAP